MMVRQVQLDPSVDLLSPSLSKSETKKKDKKKKDKKEDDEDPPICHMPKSMIVVCSVTELSFCIIMTVWSRINLEFDNDELGKDITHHPKDTTTLVWLYWSAFGTFVLLRILICLYWRFVKNRCHDSVLSGLFQLCSSLPFVCYLVLYYYMAYQLTYVNARQDVKMHLSSDNSTGVAVHSFKCSTLYTAYPACDGSSDVGGQLCCVQAMLSLQQPVTKIPYFLQMKSCFNLLSWGSILSLTMIWKDDPLIKLAATDKEFLSGAFLDILDAVMFGKYVVNYAVVAPAKGIGENKRYLEPDHSLWNATFWTFVVGFTLSLMSPALYTIFHYCDVDGEDHRTVANATEDLLAHIRLLDDEGCDKYVEEAIQLQKKEYMDSADDDGDGDIEEHPVTVFSDEKHAGPSGYAPIADVEGLMGVDVEEGREAIASLGDQPACYNVEYHDGLRPSQESNVPVAHIHADLSQHSKMCGPKCCWGWFRSKTLSPHGKHKMDIYERRAKFLDAVRSCFFLELPFFCFRVYFDIICGKGVSILLVKNAVWGFVDFLTILSCGNEKATCLSGQPIITVTKLVASTKLNKIMVAPAGLFRVATDCAVSSLKSGDEQEKRKLSEHKAWLVLEREKLEKDDADGNRAVYTPGLEPEGYVAYSSEINKLDKRINVIAKAEKATHA